MERRAHGDYQFLRRGQIIVISFFGTWNLECAQAFFSQYVEFVTKTALNRYAVVSDLTSLEGATPEAIEYFRRITEWGIENGQVARALISDSGFKQYIVESIDKNERPFPVNVFDNLEQSFLWLQGLGLEI